MFYLRQVLPFLLEIMVTESSNFGLALFYIFIKPLIYHCTFWTCKLLDNDIIMIGVFLLVNGLKSIQTQRILLRPNCAMSRLHIM